MTRHYSVLGGAYDWLKIRFIQSEALPRSGGDTSLVWNFAARSSDVIFAGKPMVRRRDISAVF